MSYYDDAEDDVAREEFYEQISAELYPEHREQAIQEFTAERLRSFYLKYPKVMQPAVQALQEGKALHASKHFAAATVFFASAVELLFKASLLKPVVYGLVHHEGLADVVVNQTLGQAGFDRYRDLMANLFRELAKIELKTVARAGSTKTLLDECTDLQSLRNGVIHRGNQCSSEASENALEVSVAAYQLIVFPMLQALGLTVVEQGEIVLR